MADAPDRLRAALADRYRIDRELGSGGMATVYLAEDLKHHRQVAIKVLKPELAAILGPERFLREIDIAARLTHPHILPLHDSGDVDGFLYYVMPYVAGESLRQRLNRERQLPLRDAIQIAEQVAGAVSYAHSLGLVHRDIKPENILLEAGQAVVADFGIARAVSAAGGDKLTQSGVAVGTPAYMSPEQASGADVDGRSDIYSLGCVVYEMLAGDPPFVASSPQALFARKSLDAPPGLRAVRETVPDAVEQTILRALARVPADRFATAAEFADALTAAGLERAVSAGPPARSVARASGWRWVAVAGLVALGLGGAAWLLRPSASGSSVTGLHTVAVLPFENLSPDPENQYFAEGMTEEIISKLGRIRNVQVTARTSVMRFRASTQDIREIAGELGVRYVLEGSVRKAGGRVRVTAQLIDASNGFHLWSDDFDGQLEDVFAVQEETALKIAEALNLRLSPEESDAVRRRYTQNPEAYDAYLRGWALVEAIDIVDPYGAQKETAAREHFQHALALDSGYALALTGLSALEYYPYWTGADTSSDRLRRAEALARRALALDPQLSQAHANLGDIYGLQGDWARAIDEFQRAIRLDSLNAWAWEELAWALVEADPPQPVEGERAAREAIRLRPGWFWAYRQLGRALHRQQRYDEAIAAYETALRLKPDFRAARVALGQIRLDRGDYQAALAELNEARRIQETPGLLVLIGAAYAGMSDQRNALAWLEQALAGGYRDFAGLEADPHYARLGADPAFQALLGRYRERAR